MYFIESFEKELWTPPETTPCYYEPDSWTDPKRLGRPDVRQHAKMMCKTVCPFQKECLEAALEYEGDVGISYRHGIWGGMSPTERNNLSEQRNKQIA